VKEVGDDVVFLHRLIAGGSDRSYGIHVGRLAGLPREVVDRAWEILSLLEAGHHVAGKSVPPPPDATQLGLFMREEHAVFQELRKLDPNTLTPIEALSRLADLKRQMEES